MDYKTQWRVLPGGNRLEDFPTVEVSVAEKKNAAFEAIGQKHRKVLARLFESILLAASVEQVSKFMDSSCVEGTQSMADEWKQLTDEIIRLERVRRSATHIVVSQAGASDNPASCILCLMKIHDQMIEDCEKKLDRLLSRYQQQSSKCKVRPRSYDC